MITDEARDAARQLLGTPLVLASEDPEGHRRIRRHADVLGAMFRTHLGYRLVVDPRFARLFKAGLGPSEGRPFLRGSSGKPFTPRDYVYLSLLCSTLLTTRAQVLLSSVVADVQQAAAEAGIVLGADSLTERRAFVHALRLLIEWGAVTEDAGSVTDYAEDSTNEALLTIDREIVRHLLAVPLREVDTPAELVDLAADAGPDAVRHQVRRRVVECPVVMTEELTEEEGLWIRRHQRREAQIIEENFGLRLEIRAEGVAALDPQDELTDIPFPREGTRGQVALLAVAALVAALRPEGASVEVPLGLLRSTVEDLLAAHGRRWAKDATDHPERLVADVEDLLVDVGLLTRRADGTLRLRAVAARYLPETVEIEAAPALTLALEDP